ncbi:TenA family transcriptional regulator [Fimbriiglobus ruber]|uniref:PqqC-like protein n=1 Tax=Fimbriiglobus ruber TaxID=1908690 RepID=A0A225DEG4_9BACT|nr:iron-containing redox enzyme family protein [Fimbriiglobus ruber]OWK34507.1 PqqC-like protein [Fimbriiglobus ruber]
MSTSTESRAPRITTRASEILGQVNILGNQFFRALEDGSMDLPCFRRTQEQFFFAVTFFPRPMSALVGRIDDPKRRLDILHNLVEEHGEFDESAFHHTTFQQFLRTIDADPSKLDAMPIWPCVRAFNSVLASACVLDELAIGVCCMGVIEQAFAGISATIGRIVVRNGWVPADRLVHYKLHAAIDERHAEEFFAVVEPTLDDPRTWYCVEQGLSLGAYIFDRLYRDLYEVAGAPSGVELRDAINNPTSAAVPVRL